MRPPKRSWGGHGHGQQWRGAAQRAWREALKLEIVAATRVPGASVWRRARRYKVHASQVSSWRRRYPATNTPPAVPASAGLLPVMITPQAETMVGAAATLPTPAASPTIEIEVGGGWRVRVHADFAPDTLRRVLDVLRAAGCASGRAP